MMLTSKSNERSQNRLRSGAPRMVGGSSCEILTATLEKKRCFYRGLKFERLRNSNSKKREKKLGGTVSSIIQRLLCYIPSWYRGINLTHLKRQAIMKTQGDALELWKKAYEVLDDPD